VVKVQERLAGAKRQFVETVDDEVLRAVGIRDDVLGLGVVRIEIRHLLEEARDRVRRAELQAMLQAFGDLYLERVVIRASVWQRAFGDVDELRIRTQQLLYADGRLAERAGRVGDHAEERIGNLCIEARLQREVLIGNVVIDPIVDREMLRAVADIADAERRLLRQSELKPHRKLLREAVLEFAYAADGCVRAGIALSDGAEQSSLRSERLREAVGEGIGESIERRDVVIERRDHQGRKAEAALEKV